MNNWRILTIRAVLGAVFGIILTRIFYPDASLIFLVGLCTCLVGLAYLSAYLRQRKK